MAGDHYIYRQLLSQFRNPTPPFDDKVNWAGLVSAYLHKLGDDQHKRKLYRAITRGSIAQAQKALVAGGGPWTVDRGHKTWANARAMHGMTERATQLVHTCRRFELADAQAIGRMVGPPSCFYRGEPCRGSLAT